MRAISNHPAYFYLFYLLITQTILTDLLRYPQASILIRLGHTTFMIIEENNQNKQGGRILKAVDYYLHNGTSAQVIS